MTAQNFVGDFDRFIAIDWSGGRGRRHKGIAVAVAEAGDHTPYLVAPQAGVWSREAVGDWLLNQPGRVLAGLDFSFSLPYLDRQSYLPELGPGPELGPELGLGLGPGLGLGTDARALWEAVEETCAGDEDLYGGRFVEQFGAHFLTARLRGSGFAARLRVTEVACRAQGLGRAESSFHLIGPTQVGLGSLAGMRLLRRLAAGGAMIWPLDAPSDITVIEMYTRLFLIQAGAGTAKIRDGAGVRAALRRLGSRSDDIPDIVTDHESDVLVAAAGMRRLQSQNLGQNRGLQPVYSGLWHPSALSDTVRRTEGWTWGVL